MLLEYRANGHQTVFPGSVHESGERIDFVRDGEPAPISKDALLGTIERLAAACLIAKRWSKGSRHDLSLSLSGTLLRGGWSIEDTTGFVESICLAAGDQEIEDRKRCVSDTAERLSRNETAYGLPKLGELLGEKVANKLKEWLGLTGGLVTTTKSTPIPMSGDDQTAQRSDTGNAVWFVRHYGEQARYCYQHGCWYLWDGRHWLRDDCEQVIHLATESIFSFIRYSEEQLPRDRQQDAIKWAGRSLDQKRLMSLLRLAQPHCALKTEQLDTYPWLLNCQNGTLDLKTGELRQHDAGDLITRILPVDHDPNAECPTWERFLKEITGDDSELVDYLQRVVGYALTGDTSEHCMFLLYGTGANGKSTFLNVLAKLLGPFAKQAQADSLMVRRSEGARTDIARLAGARLVITSEAESNHKLAEGLVKQITGGDTVTARHLYQEEFEFAPQFKLFLATNRPPNIEGTDEGIWRRIHLIPFEVTFPPDKRDKTLPDKLQAELRGVLAWAVRGCLEWQKDGLQPPESVLAATKEYRAESDVVAQFIDDCCSLDSEASIVAKDLYGSYQTWCEENGEGLVSKSVFGQRLKSRSLKQTRTKQVRSWSGIRLKDLSDDFDQ